jgi:carboxyl-terminal processing protease
VSLVAAERVQEREAREKQRLESRNRLRTFRGLEPISSLDDEDNEDDDLVLSDDDDPEGVERIMLEESARILADQIRMARPRTALVN